MAAAVDPYDVGKGTGAQASSYKIKSSLYTLCNAAVKAAAEKEGVKLGELSLHFQGRKSK